MAFTMEANHIFTIFIVVTWGYPRMGFVNTCDERLRGWRDSLGRPLARAKVAPTLTADHGVLHVIEGAGTVSIGNILLL